MSKLTDALAALKKVSKGEGVVSMNAEELTDYAQEQILKSGQDDDNGEARIASLTQVVLDAVDTFKTDPVAKHEFIPFTEPPAAGSSEALAKSVDSMTSKLDELITLLKQDNEAGNPTEDTIHPPPVPDGHEGGTVATNFPQGDDGTPRDELVKSDDAKAAAGNEAKTDDEDDEDKDDVAKAAGDDEDDANFVWPQDLNTADFRKGVTKREELSERPFWGYDNEPTPAS